MPKTDEYVKFKNYERKVKSPSIIHGDFERILVSEDTFMAINQFALMISLVSFLRHTQMKMQFTILLIV